MSALTLASWLLLLGAQYAAAGSYSYQPATGAVPNPERGFYAFSPLTVTTLQARAAEGIRLCYAPVDLQDWRTQPIGAAKLQSIRQELENVRTAGMKAIVRVIYSSAIGSPDTTLPWVQTHLAQLRPVFAEFDGSIAFYQAGCIGAWGEWHSSQYLTTAADRAGVLQALLDNLPAGRFIQVRTPAFAQELASLWTTPLTAAAAFQNTAAARLAQHNDCWRASITDVGTYPSDAVQREQQKAFVAAHSRFTPWGAETCGLAAPYTDGAASLAEAARFHATFLDKDYHPDVIAAWQADGTLAQMEQKLGSRLVLKSAALPDSLTLGQSFAWSLTLANQGWAPVFNPRPVFLRILAGTSVLADIPLKDADPRRWLPENGDITLQGQAVSPVDVGAGHLGFALWMPDASPRLRSRPEYSIRTANNGTWDAAQGHNVLHAGQNVVPASPVMDGDFSDWTGRASLSDPAGDHAGAAMDVTALAVASDASRIYFRLRFAAAGNWFASARNNVFLDLDNNPATGYAIHGLGSELLLQGGAGFAQQAGVFNAGTVSGLSFTSAPTGAATEVEFSFSRSVTRNGQPLIQGPSIAVLAESEDASWVSREFVPNTGGYVHLLALTAPEPAPALALQLLPGGLKLSFLGKSQRLHRIKASSTLTGPWEVAGSAIGAGDGSFQFLDTAQPLLPRRFYLAEVIP